MPQYYFSLRQFPLIKWSFSIHSTTPYIHLRLDSRIEPKFSDCHCNMTVTLKGHPEGRISRNNACLIKHADSGCMLYKIDRICIVLINMCALLTLKAPPTICSRFALFSKITNKA